MKRFLLSAITVVLTGAALAPLASASTLQGQRYQVLDRGSKTSEVQKNDVTQLRLESLDSRPKNTVHSQHLQGLDSRPKNTVHSQHLQGLDSRPKNTVHSQHLQGLDSRAKNNVHRRHLTYLETQAISAETFQES
jgi:hypothetical protein